jgi:DnaK suppressor protein
MENRHAALRRRLEEERSRVLRELEQVRASSPVYSAGAYSEDGGIRTSTSADAIRTLELEKSLALEQKLLGLLEDIEHALQKMDAGTYGICDRCGEPIDPARLEALPHANLCIRCKSRERTSGGRTARR